jgi:hypothetical protein
MQEGQVSAWYCLRCEESGDGPKADLASRKHTEATGHATTVHNGGLATLEQCVAEVREQLLARPNPGVSRYKTGPKQSSKKGV